MSEMPEMPEIKDSDFGWECPTCRTKIGKSFQPLSHCACGQPWVVLDAEGKRTAETLSFPVVRRGELPAVLYCSICGTVGGFHQRDCEFWEQPPVYDLAEFERQLQCKRDGLAIQSDMLSIHCAIALEAVIECLRASKREAK